jgi:hypothetical protein
MTQFNDIPLACDLTVLTPEQRERHIHVADELARLCSSTRELEDGYAFEYPGDSATILTAAEFMSLEHLCCPFFRMALEIEPGQGSVWLHLRGSSEIKAFVREEMGLA